MVNSGPSPESSLEETIVELGRLSNLSDGVFAVAITLLVLDIRLADSVTDANLVAGLLDIGPRLLVYLISFIVIGGAWGSHQRMLGQIKRGDGLLVWFNLLSLLFISLIPACSALLGRFSNEPVAIVLFALDVILVQLSALWLWRHASQHKLLNPVLDTRVVNSIGRRYLLTVMAFGLSILLILLSPILVYIVWIGLFVLIFATDWLSWQLSLKTVQKNILLAGASRARIAIGYGEGALRLYPGAANRVLLDGTFGGGLVSRTEHQGDALSVQLDAVKRRGFMSWRYPWAWGPANALDWNIGLNPEVPFSLAVSVGAGEADLDLTEMQVTDANFTASASSITIRLPAHAGRTSFKLEGSLSSYFVHVPQGVAVQLHSTKAISGLDIDTERFKMLEKEVLYRSTDYDTAANRADIQADVSLGSVQLI